eukprot:CAMPEP_0201492494 /NCGR_PEP_ID=MMETSP0151_2-20130828/33344_1 /ASSEMBLY_ACC=CAM_ASM_000257 /TAXON_ID=200890 /ORGANISM="Paramoeba atlantica, Strain 621/1 / CCAP 1560/9" /LENGTH=425 /DNA_ID=CAMNT_0047879331 /DNA_START=23 /DNA_END=1300 /DNA_ORIENTATION=+
MAFFRKPVFLFGALGATTLGFFGLKSLDSSSSFHRNVSPQFLQSFSPENAHRLAILLAKYGLTPTDKTRESSVLMTDLWGMRFSNCLGIAAGFDKHAEAMEGLFDMGFGFVEIGSVTPEPQDGNPLPRVFRLPKDKAVINRYGFNSHGAALAAERLASWRNKIYPSCTCEPSIVATGVRSSRQLLGVNLGKNKTTEKASDDYTRGLRELSSYADYVVINVSSPNTPQLRALQHRDQLSALIEQVTQTRSELFSTKSKSEIADCWYCRSQVKKQPPLLLKIAPDGLTLEDKKDIVDIIFEFGIDGLIVCNTTVSRPSHMVSHQSDPNLVKEAGGLSGAPLKDLSTELIGEMYQLTGGKVPIIGVGGISSAEDAYQKILKGASLVQVYTAFGFEGPSLVPDIKQGLEKLLLENGHKNVKQAVGAAFK